MFAKMGDIWFATYLSYGMILLSLHHNALVITGIKISYPATFLIETETRFRGYNHVTLLNDLYSLRKRVTQGKIVLDNRSKNVDLHPQHCMGWYDDRKWQDYVYIQCEYKSTKQKIKHLLREENKVKENKIS